ncbi:MAG: peroxiredoxin [Verrucomicrobiota bacterium]|nr:peroxiredoxin [Verrucomicrobiota bacterium]
MKSLSALLTHKKSLQIGDRAPCLTAVDQDGVPVDLDLAYARGPVLVYFYLREGTPVCTAHACRFRDGFSRLNESDIQIFGVSGDTSGRLQKFKEKYQLPFRLLADPEGKIAAGFGVPTFLGFPARRAFLIRDGLVAWQGKASESSEVFRLLASAAAV